jgi:hypothetical protein
MLFGRLADPVPLATWLPTDRAATGGDTGRQPTDYHDWRRPVSVLGDDGRRYQPDPETGPGLGATLGQPIFGGNNLVSHLSISRVPSSRALVHFGI